MSQRKHIGHNINPDEVLKKQAIGIAMYGTSEEYKDPDENEGDTQDSYDSTLFGEGWEEITAPSTNRGQGYSHSGKRIANRPRALKCGYNREHELLVVIFRPPTKRDKETGMDKKVGKEPWVVYEGCDLEMWNELKDYHSTGEWLRYSGIENGNYQRVPYDSKAGLDLYLVRRNKQYASYQYEGIE